MSQLTELLEKYKKHAYDGEVEQTEEAIKNLFVELNKKAHDSAGDTSTESQEAFERLVAGL